MSMPKILPTNYYDDASWAVMESEVPSGFELVRMGQATKSELLEKISNVEYLLVGGRSKIDSGVLSAAPKLKMLQRTGVGLDGVDMSALRERGVPLYVNRGVNASSVAEHTMALIFAVLRKVTVFDSNARRGHWVRHEMALQTSELKGKTVGLVGLGEIGRATARMLRAFGVNLLYYKPSRLPPSEERDLGICYADSLSALLSRSDVVSLHCPLNSQTQGMMGQKQFSEMKAGSVLINTARGKLVDENALFKALEKGHLSGAGLDVFVEEPLPVASPLLALPNVVFTPHVGGITQESFREMMRRAFENIRFFHEGKHHLLEEQSQ